MACAMWSHAYTLAISIRWPGTQRRFQARVLLHSHPDQASGERRLDILARLLSAVDLTCNVFVFNIVSNPLGPLRDRFHG